MTEYVKVFKSDTEDYHHAFQAFLDHTDQKHKAKDWLERFTAKLPAKKLFVDAGAGNGKVTAWFTGHFDQTIALEPNPSLYQELKTVCPSAETHEATILEAKVKAPADFVLASHVFYYIPKEEWIPNLTRLASWLSPRGSLVVMIQNAGTDCMGMLKHFHKRSFDLNELAGSFKKERGSRYDVGLETVESHITTPDFKTACTVAEFMMNLLPMPTPPPRSELEAYVEKNFKAAKGYRFSCHQDFLEIRPL